MLSVACAAGGCDTIGQDFGDFFKDLTPPTPAKAAEWALDPYDAENRRRGTTLLANAPWGGSEVYLRMYRERVENETDPQVISISIRALARHGDANDAVLIATRLESEWRDVRWEAAMGLQRLHNPEVADALAKRVSDEFEDPDVRESSAVALGQYPQDSAFQALVAALDARELSVNLAAQASLLTLTARDFGLDRSAWLTWYRSSPAPFADQQQYRFPTYQRPLTIWDHMVFWSPKSFEQPDVPIGVSGDGARSTYGDSEEKPKETDSSTSAGDASSAASSP
ncbi:MAG: HEAT repeat domain-containing protein [Phycisphaerales bacterium]|nr:HEAT repeat domain-containing protein [Phycisphaerales bacterium]